MDRSPEGMPPALERSPRHSEAQATPGMAPDLDVRRFMQICRTRIEKRSRARTAGQGEHVAHEHTIFLKAYREAFEVLTDNDPNLRAYVMKRVPELWDTNG